MTQFIDLLSRYVRAWEELSAFVLSGRRAQAIDAAGKAFARQLDEVGRRLEREGLSLPEPLLPYEGWEGETAREFAAKACSTRKNGSRGRSLLKRSGCHDPHARPFNLAAQTGPVRSEEGKHMTKIFYQYVGGYCLHAHPAPRNTDNPFAHGWEVCTISFAAHDYFSGEVNGFLKDACARLGIPWLEHAPRSKPSPFIQTLARERGMAVAPVSEAEAAQSASIWAALRDGASIFPNGCTTPWCPRFDEEQALFPARVDVSIHAPTELIDALLSALYDWNQGR